MPEINNFAEKEELIERIDRMYLKTDLALYAFWNMVISAQQTSEE